MPPHLEFFENSRVRCLQSSRTLIELPRVLSRSRQLIQLSRAHSRSKLFESTGLRLHWVEACMHVHFERACPKQRSKRVRRSGRSNGFEALRSHWLEATCSRSQARAFQCTGRASIYICFEASPETWASMEREARSCGCVHEQTDNELSLGEPLYRSLLFRASRKCLETVSVCIVCIRVSLQRASKEYLKSQSMRRQRVGHLMPSLARFARSLRRKRRERDLPETAKGDA